MSQVQNRKFGECGYCRQHRAECLCHMAAFDYKRQILELHSDA